MRDIILVFILLLPSCLAEVCPVAWTMWGGHCYRHFNDTSNRVNYVEAQSKCRALGSELARTTSHAELAWLSSFAHIPGYHIWGDMPLLGFKRDLSSSWDSVYNKGFPAYIIWTRFQPTQLTDYYCTVLFDGDLFADGRSSKWTAPSIDDWKCEAKYSRYICKKPVGETVSS